MIASAGQEKPIRYVRFRAEYLPMMHKFMGIGDARYYLGRVRAQPHADGGVLLTATDGHRLLLVHDKSGEANGTHLLSVDPAILAACRKRPVRARIWPRQVCWIGDRSGVYTMPLPEGKIEADQLQLSAISAAEDNNHYPDVARVLPKTGGEVGMSFVVNPRLLRDLCSIVPGIQSVCPSPMGLVASQMGALAVNFAGIERDDRCYALIMGMRDDVARISVDCDFYKPAADGG